MFGLFKKKKKNLLEVDESFVFDKAKYHLDSVTNAELDEEQAYVHTGLYFAWIVKNDLHSDSFSEESEDEIQQLKAEKITPCELYMNWDGALVGDMLNPTGYTFSRDYFDFEKDEFVNDYVDTFNCPDPNFFTVQYNWDNYHKIAKVFDKRYSDWLSS